MSEAVSKDFWDGLDPAIRERYEQQRTQQKELAQKISRLTATARHNNDQIIVKVNAQGEVIELHVSEHARQQNSAAELANIIVTKISEAQRNIKNEAKKFITNSNDSSISNYAQQFYKITDTDPLEIQGEKPENKTSDVPPTDYSIDDFDSIKNGPDSSW